MRPLEGLVTGNTSVAQLMREHDWSQTTLGPPEKWPPALRTAAAICVESPALICVFWGPEFNLIYSDAWRQLLGKQHPAAFGGPANEVFADTWDQLVSTSSQVSTTGEATSITLPHPDNHTVGSLQHSISPIRNEDGCVGGIFITSSIVPAQAPVGQVDEASYRAVLTAAAAGVSEIDAQGVFTYVNDRYCELVGRSRDELLGRMTFQDVTFPEDTSSNPKLTHSHTAGKPFTIEKRYLRPDGTVVWVNLFANWIGNGKVEPVRCIAVSIDISERKRAEEAVRKSEERKSFLLQLGDRLRPLSDPKAVMDSAAEMLGERLGVNRVSYGEVSPDGEVMTGRGYVNGVNNLPKRWRLAESAPAVLEHFRQNRTSVASDMLTEPNLTPEHREEWRRAQVRAHVSVPLSKNGELVAALGVHQATPRQWTESEISLIEETAERTWAAVEQARAEAALRSSENRLAAIFTQAAVGLSEVSLDGCFTQANDQLCKLLGRSREELLGLNVMDVTHPDDIEHSKSVVAKLLEDGVPGSLDKRCLRSDGQVVFVSSSLSRLDDEHGRPRALLLVTVDLTERKRVEAVLAEELADNKRLQEISTRLIPTDEAQNLFEELLAATVGMSRADFGTLQLFDEDKNQLHLLAAHGIAEQLQSKYRVVTVGDLTSCATAMQERQRVIVENYATDPRYAGTKAAAEHLEAGITSATSTPLISRAGRMVGMVTTHRRLAYTPDERQLRLLDIIARQAADLIERHQSEAALRTSEERYRTLFNSIDEGFCVIELYFDDAGRALDYGFVEINPVFTRQSGIVDPVGKRMREIAPKHEEHWFETYGKIALTGEPQRFVNRAESLNRWFDVYAFRFGEPQSRRVAVLFTDITERVQSEENLKQADRRKNEFLAMLAHELRNPLAPIRTGLEVLRLSQGQAQTTERMLDLMDRQMQQMVRLVDDLLDISRITQGKVQIRKQPCQLQNVLDNAIEASRPFIGDSGVKLTINTPSEPVELDADPARLAQVFSNLLNNAAKYTDPGGQVWLAAEHSQQELVVKVRDTGTGIPANMLDAVFDAFTQVDNSLGRSHGGLGVGLSLVQSLVELHGGSVTAHSDGPGKGSEFVVRLPGLVSHSSSMDGELPMLEDERRLSVSHRILVVDDNMDAANALAMMLEMLGHQVKVAHNGRDGLALAEEFQPRLLLLDLGMPELNGYDMARAVRAQRWGKRMVISALTGWGQAEDRQRSRAAGFDFHLVKPVEQEVLNDMLSCLSSDLSGESGSELCSEPSSGPQLNDCPDDA